MVVYVECNARILFLVRLRSSCLLLVRVHANTACVCVCVGCLCEECSQNSFMRVFGVSGAKAAMGVVRFNLLSNIVVVRYVRTRLRLTL